MENQPASHPLAAVSSPDHNAERLAALKQLFPDLFTNEGRLNVDELKKVVDPKLVSETERYDFRWYGKTASKREAFTPSRAALVYDEDRSWKPEKAGGNMIIEGENLEVLKLLTSAYRDRVKLIYIDPPYNTGKDFVYSDRFAEGQKPYWEQTGVTEDGVKVDTNTDSDGRFHSNWLSMMHSRLLVARYLLKPDGVIFVSIDDREVSNLRRLMDDVFGEENFVANLVWQKRYVSNVTAQFVSDMHDHILVFARNVEAFSINKLERTEEQLADYKNPDEDERGVWRAQDLSASKPYKAGMFEITTPAGLKVNPPPGRYWRCNRAQYDEWVSENRIWFGVKGDARPMLKAFLSEVIGGITPNTWWSHEFAGHNKEATLENKELFDGFSPFDTPKPVKLITRMLELVGKPGDLVLDFFGGSGTTAQAVIELNKADGGNRQFILVQLPELTAADSPTHKAGFKKISDITIERAKRVIARIQKEAEGLLPNDAQRQFADGLGFKVFKLAKSHFPRVEFAPIPDKTEVENIELLKQYIRDKEATFHIQWERETVLDEVLLKNGFMLDYTLTPHPEFTKNEVFFAKDAHKESLICLDATIAPETVDHFKKHPDPFFICLELALDTTKKWNLKHHLGDKLKAF
ncbi:MAG: site-specific DNA-methyltransferase [Candidatus Didemnitutus sp.]|nr:site-specific DNA-methyltransferase [Candidatus Didemnitutus sp.]